MAGRGSGRVYMGVDIAEGSPQGRRPLYSLAVVDEDGRLITSQSMVPLSRVIRVAWDYRPARIAFDNIMELASNVRELERILGMFPPESIIVQVTVDDRGSLRRLVDVARSHGLDVGRGKPSPVRTAYLLAVLASLGEGVPVRIVEEKTIITVTRGRSTGRGGQSQQRLQRRVRASVHLAAMRIKEALDRAGLDYDFSYRESVGGLESAVFIVYASRDKLYGIVRPHRGQDYVVTVKPVYRTRLSIPQAGRPSRPIIVGLDPGVTTGIAILDLNGRLLYLDSGKNLDRGRILEIVSMYGNPVVVAVDVAHVPEAARKLAAQLGASLYAPPQDLSTVEKRELAEKAAGRPPVDSHQRDALAAAYKAYMLLRRKLEHVERTVSRLGIDVDAETVKEAVVRGMTIAEALEAAIEEKLQEARERETAGQAKIKAERGKPEPDTTYLVERVEMLTAENRALTEKIAKLERMLEEARRDAERAWREAKAELLRDPEIARLRTRVEVVEREAARLRQELEDTRRILAELSTALTRVARGELILLRVIPSLTARNIRRSEEKLGPLLPGEVLLVESPSIVEEEAIRKLAEAGIAGVIFPGATPRLARRYMIPFIEYNRISGSIVRIAGHTLAEDKVKTLLEEEKKRMEEERRASLSLDRIIEEYRAIRRKQMRK